jgi:hypothetical protein
MKKIRNQKWSNTQLIFEPCMYSFGGICAEMPCNTFKGQLFCKQHFEEKVKEDQAREEDKNG